MRTEKVLVSIFAVSMFFKMMHWPGAGALTVFSLSILGMIYFPGAFYFLSTSRKKIEDHPIGVSVLAGMAFSIAVTGIMFTFMKWPGAYVMMLSGAVGVGIILLVALLQLKKHSNEDIQIASDEIDADALDADLVSVQVPYSKKQYYRSIVVRSIAIIMIGIIAVGVSVMTKREFTPEQQVILDQLRYKCRNGDNQACMELDEKKWQFNEQNNENKKIK